ncbi:MAG: hypothetical protein M3Z92_08595 [Bacteroidota bacterium]|nr:hypothetical protein [Bacteroidota bacterium]MDQ6889779.1 hypothetical protein [Bacteroidota bacterium]
MLKIPFAIVFLLQFSYISFAQVKNDSIIKVKENYITLSEIVVNRKLDVPSFIERVKNDTTFYKAFRNLHILSYTSLNDIRMLDKDGKTEASLRSKTKQIRTGNCRKMQTLEEVTTGNIYDGNKNFNYYTAQMYAGLFFTKDSVCGEDNIVKGHNFSTSNLSGMEKHKEQLKMLFFNPGGKINGLPFISGKTEIFDESMADKYDMDIDLRDFKNTSCYVFSVKVKNDKRKGVVINEMTTWFNEKTFEIVARKYSLSYDAGVYDFDVQMETEMTKVGDLLVPAVLRYNGNWKAIFKKRERGIFTATLFDFAK